jgi:hypothetical protein
MPLVLPVICIIMFLFECCFKDGSYLTQTPDDVSSIDPTRNAFYDVTQRIDDVIYFGLAGNGCGYLVDLRDGHFEVNGVPFRIDGVNTTGLKLVYFRRHRLMIHGVDIYAQYVEHHLGWKGLVNGEEIQRTISV